MEHCTAPIPKSTKDGTVRRKHGCDSGQHRAASIISLCRIYSNRVCLVSIKPKGTMSLHRVKRRAAAGLLQAQQPHPLPHRRRRPSTLPLPLRRRRRRPPPPPAAPAFHRGAAAPKHGPCATTAALPAAAGRPVITWRGLREPSEGPSEEARQRGSSKRFSEVAASESRLVKEALRRGV